jgi:peroxisomal membrane protein 2
MESRRLPYDRYQVHVATRLAFFKFPVYPPITLSLIFRLPTSRDSLLFFLIFFTPHTYPYRNHFLLLFSSSSSSSSPFYLPSNRSLLNMSNVGQQLLVQYITALNTNPLRTKMLTSGFLAALAEVLAGKFAGVAPATNKVPSSQSEKRAALEQQPLHFTKTLIESIGINEKAIKMFVYGFAISAPLGHVMTGILQRAFAGKVTPRDRIMQIITSNLTIAVVGNLVYLTSMAYINGARKIEHILAAIKANIMFLMKVTWVTSPISIGVAQKFLPANLWEPYFAFIRFILATTFNTIAKKKQMALQRRQGDHTKDAELRKGAAQGK